MPYPNSSLDDFRPFTGPYMRAQEMASYVEDLKFKREARDQQREQWRVQQEQLKRTNQMQDYMTRMALHQMGAAPVEQGVVGDFRAGLAGKGTMDTPVGNYSMPTMEQQAQTQGTLAGIKTKAIEEVTDPYVETDLGPEMGGTVKVPRSKVADIKIRAYDKLHPDLVKQEFTNDAGDVTTVWSDKQGNEKKRLTYPGAGKSKATGGSDYIPDYAKRSKELMDRYRGADLNTGKVTGGFYASYGITQDVYDAARGIFNAPLTDDEKQKAQNDAIAKVQSAERELFDGVDKELKNEAKNPQSQQQQATSVSPAPVAKPTKPDPRLRGKRFTKANALVAAQRLGMTPEEFSQWAHASGATIKP